VYTFSTQIGTALGTITRAFTQYTYSAPVKLFSGDKMGIKAQAAYTGTSAALKGRAFGLTARATYIGTSAALRGRPYGLLARATYSATNKFGVRLGTSVRTSYAGMSAAFKGRPASFRIQAQYTATSKQSATSGVRLGATASYSVSVATQIDPSWLPRFRLSTNTSTVNVITNRTYSITFTVTNIGDLTGQTEVSVWDVDGSLKDRFTVELSPGTNYSKTISFEAPSTKGTYYVTAQAKNLYTNRIDSSIAVQINVS
jgi:hypothetical protein